MTTTGMNTAVTVFSLLLVMVQTQNAIPACIQDAVRTGKIVCRNQDLTRLTSDIISRVSPSQETITAVELTNSVVSNLNFLNTASLSKLTSLVIENVTGIENDINGNTFSKIFLTLEQLKLTNNHNLMSLEFIANTGTRPWAKLKGFWVRGCGITAVSVAVFDKLPVLETLDLSNNRLTKLDMPKIPQLKDLIATGNAIEVVNGLDRTWYNLRSVNLQDNQLADDSILNRIPIQTTIINLSGNNLKKLQLATEIDTDLEKLYVAKNSLSEVPAFAQSGRGKLQVLDLRGNPSLELLPETLANLTQLTELRLDECSLTRIENELQNLPALTMLTLNENNLKELSSNAFAGTPLLRNIQLYRNALTNVDFLSGQNELIDLVEVNLDNNNLADLGTMTAVPKLRILRMAQNSLSSISKCKFANSLKYLRFVCTGEFSIRDCNQYSFIQLLKERKVIYNNVDCCTKGNCGASSSAPAIDFPSNYPSPQAQFNTDQCLVDDRNFCNAPARPTVSPPDVVDKVAVGDRSRKDFEGLHSAEVAVLIVGYILAFLLFLLVVLLVCRRTRSYDKWVQDIKETDQRMVEMPLQKTMNSCEKGLDAVDAPKTSTLPKKYSSKSTDSLSTLPRKYNSQAKSLDSISVASGHSRKQTGSPFEGRKKFEGKGHVPIPMEPPENRYTAPRDLDLDEAEDSPSSQSVYSYASISSTLKSRNKRHLSSSSMPLKGKRSRSEDLLETRSPPTFVTDDDSNLPPDIILERRASNRQRIADIDLQKPRSRSNADWLTPQSPKKKTTQTLTVKQMYRNPGAPTPPMSRRELPNIPNSSPQSSARSRSLPRPRRSSRDNSDKSLESMDKLNNVFSMDDMEDEVVEEPESPTKMKVHSISTNGERPKQGANRAPRYTD